MSEEVPTDLPEEVVGVVVKEVVNRMAKKIYQKYRRSKEWRERYLPLLFGDWIDLNRIRLDSVIGMKRLPPTLRERYRCPIKTGMRDRRYYQAEYGKNWDLSAAITVNKFLLLKMLDKIDQELQDKNIIVKFISSPIKKLSEILGYYIRGYEIHVEEKCCHYDRGDNSESDLSRPLDKVIIVGGFVPSEYAADVHFSDNLDFRFGLPKGQKEKLVDIARKWNVGVDLSKIKTGTETVDREELKVIREILSSDKAYEGEGIHPEWLIIDRNTGEHLVEVERERGKGGFIFVFTGEGGVRREGGRRREGIALMGAGAPGTVLAPYIVLMGKRREHWLKDDIRRELEEYNENGYQAAFEINYNPSVSGPYDARHIRSIKVKGIKPLS